MKLINLKTNLKDNFFSNFQDPQKYCLGKIGRLRLNKKLKLTTNPKSLILRPEDILAATDYLINLEYKLKIVKKLLLSLSKTKYIKTFFIELLCYIRKFRKETKTT